MENLCFYEEVTFDDLNIAEENVWIFECRCGGQYRITSNDIDCNFRIFFCSNCSLKIKLLI